MLNESAWVILAHTFTLCLLTLRQKWNVLESNNGLPMSFQKLIKTLLTKLGKGLIIGLTPGSPYQKFIINTACNETC